jgi:hypothetical protein
METLRQSDNSDHSRHHINQHINMFLTELSY